MRYSSLTLTLVMTAIIASGCTEQHDPTQHHEDIRNERLQANKPIARLQADGTMPTSDAPAAASSGNAQYDQLCATCHGIDGAASTPAAKAMSPVPRNFADAAWQKSVDDARIAKVIMEGGAAVGLSATMAPWGAMINETQLQEMVKTIRGFGLKK